MAKHLGLFDLIKIMFSRNSSYDKLTNIDKERNSFMIQRRFAINFPMQAHLFSRTGIKGSAIVDYWNSIASRNTRTPGWMYIKTKDNQTKVKKFKYTLNDEEVKILIKKREWSTKDWEDNVLLNRAALETELKKIKKEISMDIKVY